MPSHLALHWARILDCLGNLRDSRSFTDVTFVCVDGTAEAHKIVLAEHSDLFRDVFDRRSRRPERTASFSCPCCYCRRDPGGGEGGDLDPVTFLLPGVSVSVINELLELLYSGETTSAQVDLLHGLCKSLKVQIPLIIRTEEAVCVNLDGTEEDEEEEEELEEEEEIVVVTWEEETSQEEEEQQQREIVVPVEEGEKEEEDVVMAATEEENVVVMEDVLAGHLQEQQPEGVPVIDVQTNVWGHFMPVVGEVELSGCSAIEDVDDFVVISSHLPLLAEEDEQKEEKEDHPGLGPAEESLPLAVVAMTAKKKRMKRKEKRAKKVKKVRARWPRKRLPDLGREQLKVHIIPCPTCGKSFPKRRIREHLASTHLVKQLGTFVSEGCSLCGFVTRSVGDFQLHLSLHHEGEEKGSRTAIAAARKSWSCTLCDFSCKAKHLCARHVGLAHNGIDELADPAQKMWLETCFPDRKQRAKKTTIKEVSQEIGGRIGGGGDCDCPMITAETAAAVASAVVQSPLKRQEVVF